MLPHPTQVWVQVVGEVKGKEVSTNKIVLPDPKAVLLRRAKRAPFQLVKLPKFDKVTKMRVGHNGAGSSPGGWRAGGHWGEGGAIAAGLWLCVRMYVSLMTCKGMTIGNV